MKEAVRELDANDLYRALGVRRVINAVDTLTGLGGSRLPREVVRAMERASEHQVDVKELLSAVGRRLALLTHNPAALVVNGAAAGIAVSIAAAQMVARGAESAVRLQPPNMGLPEVIVLGCQRNVYDNAVFEAGAVIRQVGYADSTSLAELRAAFTDRTVAVLWFAGKQYERYSPSLEVMADIAHETRRPLIVDAAAQLPPVSNLWTYRERGADLVIFSGGKGLKGPQASGLIVGSDDWIIACATNSYPNQSVGRPMKTSKENILGLLAAVELSVSLDWEPLYREWHDSLVAYSSELEAIGLKTWIDPEGNQGQACPRLFFSWDEHRSALSKQELERRLAAQTPSIRIGTAWDGARTAYVNPYSLLPGEGRAVIDAITNAFPK